MGIFFGGSFAGGHCPLGIIRVAIFRVGAFMLPDLLNTIPLTRTKTLVNKLLMSL